RIGVGELCDYVRLNLAANPTAAYPVTAVMNSRFPMPAYSNLALMYLALAPVASRGPDTGEHCRSLPNGPLEVKPTHKDAPSENRPGYFNTAIVQYSKLPANPGKLLYLQYRSPIDRTLPHRRTLPVNLTPRA